MAAYGDLFLAHRAGALRSARRLAPTQAAADDLVGDAFATTLRAIRHGHGPHDHFAWYLHAAIRHGAARTANRQAAEAQALRQGEASRVEPMDRWDDDGSGAALAALHALTPRQQVVLFLVEVEGRPIGEVARWLGVSSNAASAVAYRARNRLKAAYVAGIACPCPASAGHQAPAGGRSS